MIPCASARPFLELDADLRGGYGKNGMSNQRPSFFFLRHSDWPFDCFFYPAALPGGEKLGLSYLALSVSAVRSFLRALARGLRAEPQKAGEDGPAADRAEMAVPGQGLVCITVLERMRLAMDFHFPFPGQDCKNHWIHVMPPNFIATGCKTGQKKSSV
jgi:hypothetical protein